MQWQEIEGTELSDLILDSLIERPYLALEDLVERLSVSGVETDADELQELLDDPYSPFECEPQRWFVDPSFAAAYTDVSAAAAAEEAYESEQGELLEPEGLSIEEDLEEDWAGPNRWIGPQLRQWQEDAFSAWTSAEPVEHGIVEAITGTGKTVVGAYAAAFALDYGYKVVITVPTIDLMDQWVEQIESCIDDVMIGRLGDGQHDSIEDVEVLIATINSGSRRYMHSTTSETLLIADEVHRMGSDSFSLGLEEQFSSRLAATLERNNDKGVEQILLPYFGGIVYSYGYAEALEDEVLAPFRLVLVGVDFTEDEEAEFSALGTEMGRLKHQLSAAGLLRGDGPEIFGQIGALSKSDTIDFRHRRWAQKFMTNLNRRRKLQASAENKIKAIGMLSDTIALSERTLVFTETKDAAASIAESLCEDSIEAWAFDSGLDRAERSELLERFKDGDVQVLCAPRVLDEGIDVPQADVGVIVSASQSRRQMIQRLGRIVRPNESGDPSTLFLLYLTGTREDPDQGGHEGFLEEVLPHACEVTRFSASTDSDTIARWYAG
jgi:RNA polymerase primary sigma factor